MDKMSQSEIDEFLGQMSVLVPTMSVIADGIPITLDSLDELRDHISREMAKTRDTICEEAQKSRSHIDTVIDRMIFQR